MGKKKAKLVPHALAEHAADHSAAKETVKAATTSIPHSRGKPVSASLRACIKVPEAGHSSERALYESFPADVRRQMWTEHVLGPDGMYVGRPKNDGGWYQVQCVKHGSIFANPFPLTEYSLEESLKHYAEYLHKRMDPDVPLSHLIELLPEKERRAATHYYLEGSDKGKSAKHLELSIRGPEFVERLRQVKGKRLACFCDLSHACHVDILLRTIESLH